MSVDSAGSDVKYELQNNAPTFSITPEFVLPILEREGS